MFSFARLPSRSSPRGLVGVLLLIAALAAVSGCASDGFFPPPSGDESDAGYGPVVGTPPGCVESGQEACVISSEGCDPAAISGSASERCATCDAGEGAYEICGAARTARCFDLELGHLCQRCVADDGEVLYDDCSPRADDLGDLRCEAVAYGDDDALRCEVCRDDNGVVVRESCRPNASRCEERVVNGRDCRECFTAEGAFAYRECQPVDLDPAVCEVYGDDAGRCVDCYGHEGELLSHQCTLNRSPGHDPGEPPQGDPAPSQDPGYCDSVADPGGRTCTRCYSAEGALLDETCDEEAEGSPGRCEELAFQEQSCLVCVDGRGQESSTQCVNTSESCSHGAPCPVAPCENRYLDDGTLCRVCPSEGDSETLCMSGGALVCATSQEFDEDPGGAEAPALISVVCTTCHVPDEEEPAYHVCSSDGTVPPQPVCSSSADSTGASCERCVDPVSGAEVYSSCPE